MSFHLSHRDSLSDIASPSEEATGLFNDSVDAIIDAFEQQQKYAATPIAVRLIFLAWGLVVTYIHIFRRYSLWEVSQQMNGSGLDSSRISWRGRFEFSDRTVIGVCLSHMLTNGADTLLVTR